MNKKFIIKKNREIQALLKRSKKIVSKYFIIYYMSNNLSNNRYCISISKKVGKANIRNLYKRRIKDILMKNYINYATDYVIIVRKQILDIPYLIIKEELLSNLRGE